MVLFGRGGQGREGEYSSRLIGLPPAPRLPRAERRCRRASNQPAKGVARIGSTRAFWLRFAVGLAIGLLCLVLAVRSVDLAEVLTRLQATDPALTGLGVVAVMLTTVAKSWRWAALAGRSGRAGWGLFPAVVVGQMINTLVPARLGDLARLVLGDSATGCGKAFLLGTIVLEKLIDGLCVLAVALLVLPFLQLPDWLVARGLDLGLGVVALGMGIGGLVLLSDRVLALVAGLLGRLPLPVGWQRWLTHATAEAVRGLGALASWSQRGRVAWWSFLAWASSIATTWLVLRAVGLEVDVGPAILVTITTQVGGSVPMAPGRVGVFHSLVMAPLLVLGIGTATALTAAVVLHLVVFGPQLVLGILFLWRESVTLRHFPRLS
jgi:uncharacterized membrane protein YbhN (UPF0104 family)